MKHNISNSIDWLNILSQMTSLAQSGLHFRRDICQLQKHKMVYGHCLVVGQILTYKQLRTLKKRYLKILD